MRVTSCFLLEVARIFLQGFQQLGKVGLGPVSDLNMIPEK